MSFITQIIVNQNFGCLPFCYFGTSFYHIMRLFEILNREKRANIEAKDKDQKTPLHLASKYGKTDVVHLLVSKGANKSAKNKDGKTPYNLTKKDEIKELLQ